MLALRRLPVVADMTLVTAGAMTANVAGYLLQVLAAGWLGVDGYSGFASLLAVQLLAAVPALALQNVVARELVRGADIVTVRRLTWRCAGIVVVVAAVLVPVAAVILHVNPLAAGGALAAAPILVLLSGEQGILQGGNQFRWLAIVLGGVGIARVTPAVIALGLGGGSAAALWAGGAGLVIAAGAAHRVTRTVTAAEQGTVERGGAVAPRPDGAVPGTSRSDRATSGMSRPGGRTSGTSGRGGVAPGTPRSDKAAPDGRRPDSTPGSSRSGGGDLPEASIAPRDAANVTAVLRAVQVQAALMALSSADLIVARIVLDEGRASLYALGAIATKIAFWLPQAVGMVLYPRMAQPQQSVRALRSALAVLAGVGLLAVAGAAVFSPLAPVLAGDDYAPIQQWLWLFALEGALLALLQGALLSAIAADRTAPAAVLWAGLVIELAVTLPFVRSLPVLITVATVVAATVTTLLILIVIRTGRRTPAADSDPPPLPVLPTD